MMKKQLLLFVLCSGVTVGSLTAAPAKKSGVPAELEQKSSSFGWVKQKMGAAYNWTKAEAGIAKDYVYGRTNAGYNWTKQFTSAHKTAIIVTSSFAAAAAATYYALKACNKCEKEKSVNAYEEVA